MSHYYIEKEKLDPFEKGLKEAVEHEIEGMIGWIDDFIEKYNKKKFWKSKNDYFILTENTIVELSITIPLLMLFKKGKISRQNFYDSMDKQWTDETIQIKLLEDGHGNRDFSIHIKNEEEEAIRNQ